MQITDLKQININQIKYNENITYYEFRQIIKSATIECYYNDKQTIFTYINSYNDTKKQILVLSKNDFTQLLIILFKNFIQTFCQNTRKNEKSVKTFNFHKFTKYCPIALCLIIILFFVPYVNILLKTLILSYYSLCILIKSYFLIISSIKRDDFKNLVNDNIYKNIDNLPKYTILIPMFKENKNTIQQAIQSIINIDYPQDLLDVKLVLEEDDLQTKNILKNINLPVFITKIWVPYFEPRTKPKACNVASLFAEGEILVIFDAEDKPDILQLKTAVYAFQQENNSINTQILQGCLSFYNYNKNILTECFNIEYNVWFKIALKMFAEKNITIPLGGTTNHIKYNFLEKHNFWDSYNVTEDLELSVIANKYDIKIEHLNSDTKEWCVEDIKSFIKQRTRWLKGYLLTYLLHFFDKQNTKNIQNFIFMHVIIGYSALAFLLIPFLLLSLITNEYYTLSYIWLIVNMIYYLTYIFLYYSLCKNIDVLITKKRLCVFCIYPFYFILHIISSWLSLFEIFYKPFYWSKTNHLNKN